MDVKRAREIISSTSMIKVTYNGSEVYIKAIDENKGMANIHPVGQHDMRQDVPIRNLVESN